jgi:MoaA/NifB/PqqE/SkfB family radical SAM enzyme
MTKCILPWIHLETTATGSIKPCCLFNGNIEINGKPASLNTHTVDEIWNSDYMNNLRKDFINDKKPTECCACWEQETVGKKSKRIVSNEKFSYHKERYQKPLELPIYLDLKLGTVCNLKCRSCSTYSSSKWAEDEKKLYGKTFNINLHSHWIDDDSKFWKEIEKILPTIEQFDFTGGEPFLIKKHFDILRKCVELDCAKNIEIHYNTNGTIKPSDKIFQIWKNFKNVDVMFSLDGTKEKFEYLRNPAKWSEVVSVFETFLKYPNIYTHVCYSVSIFNILYIPEFIKWFNSYSISKDRIYFNIIFNPSYLNVQSLPFQAKLKIREEIEKNSIVEGHFKNKIAEIINFMFENNLILENENEFQIITKKLDIIRQESFNKTFPKLYEILNQ